MDRGYHRHTLKFLGDQQRFDAARTEGADDFDVPDGIDFFREICETRVNFTAPSQNLHAIMEKRPFL